MQKEKSFTIFQIQQTIAIPQTRFMLTTKVRQVVVTKDLEIKNRKFINVGFLSDRSDASDKRYVDTITNNILSAHETFHGDINMNNHHIKNSHAPTSNNNAANKIIL